MLGHRLTRCVSSVFRDVVAVLGGKGTGECPKGISQSVSQQQKRVFGLTCQCDLPGGFANILPPSLNAADEELRGFDVVYAQCECSGSI